MELLERKIDKYLLDWKNNLKKKFRAYSLAGI